MLVLVEVLALIVASEYSLSISIVLFSLLMSLDSLGQKNYDKSGHKRHKDSNGKRTKGVSAWTFIESRRRKLTN